MDVFELGKFCQDKCELFRKICLCKFHFPHVKAADSGDLVVLVDHRGSLPLGLGQHDVREVRAGRHHADLLEVIVSHLDGYDYHLCKIRNLTSHRKDVYTIHTSTLFHLVIFQCFEIKFTLSTRVVLSHSLVSYSPGAAVP